MSLDTSANHESNASIEGLIERGERAMAEISGYDQEAVDELVRAVAWAIYEEGRARDISELAVETTGLGNVEDKTAKKRRKTFGTLNDLLGEPSVGVIDRRADEGITEIAKPVGVVGAVVPSTNPGATPVNIAMMALKGKNAVILSPSPSGFETCKRVVEYIHEQLTAIGAPTDLIGMVPPPVTKEKTYDLMDQVDLLQVTGSANNVRRGEQSGTPNYNVGEGNAVSIVDGTADIEETADRIATSKAFDYATSCSSDNAAVIVESVYDETIAALEDAGGYPCNEAEREKLEATMFPEGAGSLSGAVTGQSPAEIAEAADIEGAAAREADFFLVEGHGIGPEYPLSGEKISVVLTTYSVPDFEAAIETTGEILDYEGSGHSCGLHTTSEAHRERVGHEIDVCRLLINQPQCVGNGGSFENGLNVTLSMGAGTWGGNQLDENLDYTHFINTTTVAETIDPDPPSEADLFGPYLDERDR